MALEFRRPREIVVKRPGRDLLKILGDVLSIVLPLDCTAFRVLVVMYAAGWLATTLWSGTLALAVTAASIRDPLQWHTLATHVLVHVGVGNLIWITVLSGIPIRFLSARMTQTAVVLTGFVGAIVGAGVYSAFTEGPMLVSSGLVGWSLGGAVVGSLAVSLSATSLVEVVYAAVMVLFGLMAVSLNRTVLTWAMVISTMVGAIVGAAYYLLVRRGYGVERPGPQVDVPGVIADRR